MKAFWKQITRSHRQTRELFVLHFEKRTLWKVQKPSPAVTSTKHVRYIKDIFNYNLCQSNCCVTDMFHLSQDVAVVRSALRTTCAFGSTAPATPSLSKTPNQVVEIATGGKGLITLKTLRWWPEGCSHSDAELALELKHTVSTFIFY